MRFLKASAVLIALATMIAWAGSPARAMSVSPTHIEMTSAGSGSRTQIVVQNDSDAPLPVEAVIKQLSVDENGVQKTSDGSQNFLVFPPQTMIPAGGTQVFRVSWVGEPMLRASESYVITIAQLPVKMQTKPNQVQVVMAFGVVINVAPPEGSAALRLVGSDVARGKDGKNNLVVTVENPANVHALLPKATIHLAANGWSKTLTPQQLEQLVGIGLVQPGKRRRFVLHVPLPANVSRVEAKLNYPGR